MQKNLYVKRRFTREKGGKPPERGRTSWGRIIREN